MKGAVYVVFKETIPPIGLKIHAICTSKKAAAMARNRLCKFRRSGKFYDINPDGNPYAVEMRVVKVQVDVLYLSGLDERKLDEFAGNGNESEVIR